MSNTRCEREWRDDGERRQCVRRAGHVGVHRDQHGNEHRDRARADTPTPTDKPKRATRK